MSSVQMVAKIGDQTIRVGTCHPGQARILVKKDHAAWDDGQLILYLRPAHLQLAENTRRLVDDEEAYMVSEAEVERRLHWLRKLLMAVVQTDTHGSDLETIVGPQGDRDPMDGLRHVAKVVQETKGRDAHRITLSGLREGVGLQPPAGLTPEELDEWFSDDESSPENNTVTFAEMTALWDRPNEHGDWFYSALGQVDSRNAPVRTEEPGPMRKPDEADALTLAVHASVVGEDGNMEAEWVKTDFEHWRDEVDELPVQFSLRQRRSPNAHWPDKRAMDSLRCPSCGKGIDTDGDGDCAVCGPRVPR